MADSALPPPLSDLNPPPKADPDLTVPPYEPPSPSSSPPLLSPQLLSPETEPQFLNVTLDRWNERMRLPIRDGCAISVVKKGDGSGGNVNGGSSDAEKSLEEYLREWKEKRTKDGVDERDCVLPFLTHEPKLVECKLCYKSIYPKEEIRCIVSGCQSAFHLNCAERSFKLSKEKIFMKDERNSKKRKKLKGPKFEGLQFKCPQHGCFVCKQVGYWRCVRCVSCSHTKCAPWCERVRIPPGQHARAVCWKHPSDWLLQSQHADVTQSIQEVFDRLPLPYFEEEFNFSTGMNNADVAEKKDDMTAANVDVEERMDDTAEMNDDMAMRNDYLAEINDVVMKNDDVAERNDVVMKNDYVAEINDVVIKNDYVAEINDVLMKNDYVAEINDVVMKNDDVAMKNDDVAEKNDDMSERNDVIMKNDVVAERNDVIMKNDVVAERNNDVVVNNTEPAPFVRIRRNVYLVKRKRESHAGVGCTDCTSDSVCKEDCECRGLSVSCSKACHCSDFCTNKPFRKEKKIKIVKTEQCGWGVITLEPLAKGDFIVEYIGEVIDDITCEKRLWDIKKRGDFNFYMCEISKDFTIDATFKGNTSRFLNHSCDPNCKLEKWQVDGETRVGVFASRSIKSGEPLTYDYRFVHFGPMVVCKCGASNCQGFLGSKKIVNQLSINISQESIKVEIERTDEEKLIGWGQKTKRSEMTKIRNQTPSIDFQNQLTTNQINSNDSQNHFDGNQTSPNDSQNQLIRNQTPRIQLIRNQTPSNDSQNQLIRNQTPQNQLIRNQTPSNGPQTQLIRNRTPQNQIIRNQTPQNQIVRNQTPSNGVQNQLSNAFQNQTIRNQTIHEMPSIRAKEGRPLSWGRRIKRSYTVSVDQNGSGN